MLIHKPAVGTGKAFLPALAAALAFTLASPNLAHADDLVLECLRADIFNPNWDGPATFAFEGGEHGTLKVSGALGEFTIPASRRPTNMNAEVMKESINTSEKARVNLPALSDLETCMDKVPGALSAPVESDLFLDTRDECMRALPAAPSGVDAVAQIMLGISGGPGTGEDEDASVVFKLIYDAPSRAPGGKMFTEGFPAQCTLRK